MTGRAFITGAGGFVGQRLVQFLRREGWDVVPSGYPANPDLIPCDVTHPASIRAALDAAGDITHVFHLGAIAFVPQADSDPTRAMDVNLNGTIRLCEALRALKAPPRLIFVGSSEVYGPPMSLPMTEEHPLNPANVYSISKAAADHYCASLSRIRALDIVRMRPFNHAGPGQSEQYVLSSFARQIAAIEAGQSEPVVRVGNLEAARDFLHVDDVIRAYLAVSQHAAPGSVYNVCSGQSYRIQEALDKLLALSSTAIAIEQDATRMRPSDVPEVRGAHDKLTADTGWKPSIDFDTVLDDLLTYWRDALSREAQ